MIFVFKNVSSVIWIQPKSYVCKLELWELNTSTQIIGISKTSSTLWANNKVQ